MATFAIGETDFLLDGQPYRVLSGAIHYFRVHPDQWADRIRKARLMGLNTIETYVAWNAHEPLRGGWDATGPNDLGRFLDLVAAEGLHAIVRPGPYICAEWHNGGLPLWLTGTPGIGLRRSEPQYLAEVTSYLRRVYDIIAPRQIDRGGPVILVQIENEYGAYCDDKDYLAALVHTTRAAGISVELSTIDQPIAQMLRDGSLPGVHLTGSFGSRATERLAILREHQPTGPLMCMEFWDGWFDSWGQHHHTTGVQESADELDAMLKAGASVNFYMFHGGTNFGLTNGANDKGRYRPITTSYDYDAPLDEAGNPTAKYFAYRDVIARYAPVPQERIERGAPAPAFEVPLAGLGEWASAASLHAVSAVPPSFDDLARLSALVRYEADLPTERFASGRPLVLEFDEVRDFAWVDLDGVRVGTIARSGQERSIALPPGRRVSILVEDLGRVNYASRLGEPKGLIGVPTLGGEPLTGWTATPIEVAQVAADLVAAGGVAAGGFSGAPDSAGPVAGPVVLHGAFECEHPTDLFLDTATWGKGYAFVNGFFLGRYWRNGPQRTLYVPAPVVVSGRNCLLVLELEHVRRSAASFVPAPLLGYAEE